MQNWHGHVGRMNDGRLPKKILQRCPPGRRRSGRPRNSWMQKVTTGMRENGMDRQARMEKKNKTLGTERCENIDSLSIFNMMIFSKVFFYLHGMKQL